MSSAVPALKTKHFTPASKKVFPSITGGVLFPTRDSGLHTLEEKEAVSRERSCSTPTQSSIVVHTVKKSGSRRHLKNDILKCTV